MTNFKEKLKNGFYKARTMFSGGEWVVVALILLALIGLEGYNIRNKHKSENPPEVAQVYEPSIGEPLPPDVQNNSNDNKGTVSGATDSGTSVTATVPSDKSNPTANPPEKKIAPKTGVDLYSIDLEPRGHQ